MWLWQLLILNMLLCFRLLHLRLNEHVVMLIAIEDALKLLVIVRSISSLAVEHIVRFSTGCSNSGSHYFCKSKSKSNYFVAFNSAGLFRGNGQSSSIMCLDSSFSVFDLRGWILLLESKVAVKFYCFDLITPITQKGASWSLLSFTKLDEEKWESQLRKINRNQPRESTPIFLAISRSESKTKERKFQLKVRHFNCLHVIWKLYILRYSVKFRK